MELCAKGHSDIVYDDAGNCPLCDALKDVGRLEREVEELEAALSEMGG